MSIFGHVFMELTHLMHTVVQLSMGRGENETHPFISLDVCPGANGIDKGQSSFNLW